MGRERAGSLGSVGGAQTAGMDTLLATTSKAQPSFSREAGELWGIQSLSVNLTLMGALPFTRVMDVFGKTRIALPTEILGLNQFNIFICNQFWRTLYRQIHGCWSFFHGMRLNINIFCTRLFPLLTTLVRLCSFRIVCVYSKQWSWDMYCFMD
jgi:hypothetical protein